LKVKILGNVEEEEEEEEEEERNYFRQGPKATHVQYTRQSDNWSLVQY